MELMNDWNCVLPVFVGIEPSGLFVFDRAQSKKQWVGDLFANRL